MKVGLCCFLHHFICNNLHCVWYIKSDQQLLVYELNQTIRQEKEGERKKTWLMRIWTDHWVSYIQIYNSGVLVNQFSGGEKAPWFVVFYRCTYSHNDQCQDINMISLYAELGRNAQYWLLPDLAGLSQIFWSLERVIVLPDFHSPHLQNEESGLVFLHSLYQLWQSLSLHMLSFIILSSYWGDGDQGEKRWMTKPQEDKVRAQTNRKL